MFNIIDYINAKRLERFSYGELYKTRHEIFKKFLEREYLLEEKPFPKVILSKKASWIWKNLTRNKYCWFRDNQIMGNSIMLNLNRPIVVDVEFGTFEKPYVKFVDEE